MPNESFPQHIVLTRYALTSLLSLYLTQLLSLLFEVKEDIGPGKEQ